MREIPAEPKYNKSHNISSKIDLTNFVLKDV